MWRASREAYQDSDRQVVDVRAVSGPEYLRFVALDAVVQAMPRTELVAPRATQAAHSVPVPEQLRASAPPVERIAFPGGFAKLANWSETGVRPRGNRTPSIGTPQ
jgi:hypothetical protein